MGARVNTPQFTDEATSPGYTGSECERREKAGQRRRGCRGEPGWGHVGQDRKGGPLEGPGREGLKASAGAPSPKWTTLAEEGPFGR